MLLLIIWRLILFIIAFIATQVGKFTPQYPYSDIYQLSSGLPQWIWSFANFDGVHYITIAKSGYIAQFTQAFFPLYPLLVKLFAFVIFDKTLIISGLIISFIFFALGIWVFRKLLALDYQKKEINHIILFLLIFPTSFYFASMYTESLFFLLVVCSFWFARKKLWWLSGLMGLLASSTRITGILLLPALLWEWYFVNSKYQSSLQKNRSQKFKLFWKSLFNLFKSPLLYLIPMGLISYMIYLQYKFGDWLYFWHAQSVFGAARSGSNIIVPLQVIWRYIKIFTSVNILTHAYFVAIVEFLSLVITVILLIIAHQKHVRFSYLIFSWLVILIPMMTGTLTSIPRYVLLAFPIFISLGLIKSTFWRVLILLSNFIFLIIFLINFVNGIWVA